MFYSFDVTVTTSHTAENPKHDKVKVARGILTRTLVQFPNGLRAAIRTRVQREGASLYPSNPSGHLASDGYTIEINDHYQINDAPYEFDIYSWSLADSKSHTITWMFEVQESGVFDYFMKIFRGIEKLLKLANIRI